MGVSTIPNDKNDGQGGTNSQYSVPKQSAGSATIMTIVGLADQLDKMEREDEDPNAAAFAGNFGSFYAPI